MKTAYIRTAALGGILMVLLCAGCGAGPASNGRIEPETAGLEETDIQKETVREEITLMHADAGKEEFEAYIRRAGSKHTCCALSDQCRFQTCQDFHDFSFGRCIGGYYQCQ